MAMDRDAKLQELRELEARAAKIREELHVADAERPQKWAPEGYYLSFHIMSGMMLGFVGAVVSLLLNVVGSVVVGGQHPLELIRVYLTFPLGEQALTIDNGLALAVGCMLYTFTGMGLGIPFHLVLSRWFEKAPVAKRFAVVTALGLGLWVFNYYLVLSWLQPALFGGNWIVARIPAWVGALTHLSFAWTMLAVEQWGQFEAPHFAPDGAQAAAAPAPK
jgi:hypothetical protein